MPYSDKDKQREANRLAKQKQREGMTSGMTSAEGMTTPAVSEGMTSPQGMTDPSIAKGMTRYDNGMTPKTRRVFLPRGITKTTPSWVSLRAALIDPEQRAKIARIIASVKAKKLLPFVMRGADGITLEDIDNLGVLE